MTFPEERDSLTQRLAEGLKFDPSKYTGEGKAYQRSAKFENARLSELHRLLIEVVSAADKYLTADKLDYIKEREAELGAALYNLDKALSKERV